MLQNALPAIGLLLIMMVVAWLLQRWRRHLPNMARQAGPALKVMNALPLGPQQRVVTVQVGDGERGVCLVLGVTPGGITALHQCPLTEAEGMATPDGGAGEGFKARLKQLTQPPSESPHAPG
ncbi:MAG: flagellar biosynthetic protein FliO [Burkholderiaceae bacterium]